MILKQTMTKEFSVSWLNYSKFIAIHKWQRSIKLKLPMTQEAYAVFECLLKWEREKQSTGMSWPLNYNYPRFCLRATPLFACETFIALSMSFALLTLVKLRNRLAHVRVCFWDAKNVKWLHARWHLCISSST